MISLLLLFQNEQIRLKNGAMDDVQKVSNYVEPQLHLTLMWIFGSMKEERKIEKFKDQILREIFGLKIKN
jgi:hypothetical protein